MADQPKTADQTAEHAGEHGHAEHHHDPVLHVKDGYFFEVPRGLLFAPTRQEPARRKSLRWDWISPVAIEDGR